MKIMVCRQCGKECKVPPSKEKGFQFCSTECRAQALGFGKRVALICAFCGKSFEVVPAKAKQARTRFCSKECQANGVGEENYIKAGQDTTCIICGMVFPKKKGCKPAKTCSLKCAGKLKSINSTGKGTKQKVVRICETCGSRFDVLPSRSYYKHCSKECRHKATGEKNIGQYRSRVFTNCEWCNKPVSKRKSYIKNHIFCSTDCYHAWDSNRKKNPDTALESIKHLIGSHKTVSKIEDRVAEWLTANNISFERQIRIGCYLVDFLINNAVVIEVNGCYWHGCVEHHPAKSKDQVDRITRDKRLKTHCQKQNIPMFTIWEHDILSENYSALKPIILNAQPAQPASSRAPGEAAIYRPVQCTSGNFP